MRFTKLSKIFVKNWQKFQHYKNRCPPWIKLHKGILDDYKFHCLPVASKALAPLIWLLASESEDGSIEWLPEALAFRLRMTEKELIEAIKPLIDNDFLEDASKLLAPCKSDATLETERETETEEERELPNGNVGFVFDYWRTIHNHPRAVLDKKRKKKITEALKNHPVEFLKKAIDGCKLSPYHMGKNESGTIYDDVELILRDTPHIEKFAGFVDRPPTPKLSKAELRANTIQALTGQSPQGGENGRVIDITPAAAAKR